MGPLILGSFLISKKEMYSIDSNLKKKKDIGPVYANTFTLSQPDTLQHHIWRTVTTPQE